MGCPNCVGCIDDDRENEGICCGYACMDLLGYSDIPSCDECNILPIGGWPDSGYIGGIGNFKRETLTLGNFSQEVSLPIEQESRQLDRRVLGMVTTISKRVTICGRQYYASGTGQYPGFTRSAAWPWDGIHSGRWDSTSKYWENSSASCTDWGGVSTSDQSLIQLPQMVSAQGRNIRVS